MGELFHKWGDLRIEGYIGGKLVITKRLSGTGVDAKFLLFPTMPSWMADGADSTQSYCGSPTSSARSGHSRMMPSKLESRGSRRNRRRQSILPYRWNGRRVDSGARKIWQGSAQSRPSASGHAQQAEIEIVAGPDESIEQTGGIRQQSKGDFDLREVVSLCLLFELADESYGAEEDRHAWTPCISSSNLGGCRGCSRQQSEFAFHMAGVHSRRVSH